MRRIMTMCIVCMLVCMLTACTGSDDISGDEINTEVSISTGETGVFIGQTYYRIKNKQIISVDDKCNVSEIYTGRENEIINMLLSRDGVMYALAAEFYLNGNDTKAKYILKQWDNENKEMKELVSFEVLNANINSIALTGTDLYYTVNRVIGNVGSIGGISYSDSQLFRCGIHDGKTKLLLECNGDETHFNNQLIFCKGDNIQSDKALLAYSYADKDSSQEKKYAFQTEFYDLSISKNKTNKKLAMEDGYIKGMQKGTELYYMAENTNGVGYTLNRFDLNNGVKSDILAVQGLMTGGLGEDYVTGLVDVETQQQYLYSYAQKALLISKDGIYARTLDIENGRLALDAMDYRQITTQEEDMGIYETADADDYIKENYKPYEGEGSESLTYFEKTDIRSSGSEASAEAVYTGSYEDGEYSIEGNAAIFTAEDGRRQTIMEAGEHEEICRIDAYGGNAYMFVRIQDEDQEFEELVSWIASEQRLHTLLTEEKKIEDIAFCEKEMYCLYTDETKRYAVIHVNTEELSGESGVLEDPEVRQGEATVQFDKRVFEKEEAVTVTADFGIKGEEKKQQYQIGW